jgi:acetylcholinesterase
VLSKRLVFLGICSAPLFIFLSFEKRRKTMLSYRFLYLFLHSVLPLTSGASLSVRTTVGTVKGFIDEVEAPGVVQFLGVPFAEPPVGKRRWLPAIFKSPVEGVIEANKLGLNCPQFSSGPTVYTVDAPEFLTTPNVTSEDCLTLNIWAPVEKSRKWKKKKEKLPVIVWIYGGGFQLGGGDIKYQIPTNWVQRSGKHIVVGIK